MLGFELTARTTPATLVNQLGVGIERLAPADIIPRGGGRVRTRGRSRRFDHTDENELVRAR